MSNLGSRKGPGSSPKYDWDAILHPDRLGFVLGGFFATLVLAFGFLRGVNELEVAFRFCVTFALVWLMTFFVVTLVRTIAVRELGPFEESAEPGEPMEEEAGVPFEEGAPTGEEAGEVNATR